MTVPLDHLRGHRGRRKSQAGADALFGLWSDGAERAHGPRDLSQPQSLGRGAQTLQIAAGFFVPDRQLESEGDRLGVNPMGAADLHGVLELERPTLEGLTQSAESVEQDARRL